MLDSMRLLSQCMLFSGLSEEQLAELYGITSKRCCRRGAVIFREAEAGIGFYIIASGKVKVFKTSPEGKEQILHIFGPGEPIGEVPVFHGQPYPANAAALSEAELYFSPDSALSPCWKKTLRLPSTCWPYWPCGCAVLPRRSSI